jgi:hypothetical protein
VSLTAIHDFVFEEISALRGEEERLQSALASAKGGESVDGFIRALAALDARVDHLNRLLDRIEAPQLVAA